ncbi:hypothetical protein Tco_0355958 [Tanacetum coccineum]
MSKLDRFLISEGSLAIFPSISALCLDKHLSDHQPILLRELNIDYGPTPLQFFHSCSSRKDGDWIVEPSLVKNEFLKHFATRFATPSSSSITFDSQFPNRLSPDQNKDLERNVSYEEIKRAVWDCSLPPGCNSSFIALIPKSQEAKMVKDFRPISLIETSKKRRSWFSTETSSCSSNKSSLPIYGYRYKLDLRWGGFLSELMGRWVLSLGHMYLITSHATHLYVTAITHEERI